MAELKKFLLLRRLVCFKASVYDATGREDEFIYERWSDVADSRVLRASKDIRYQFENLSDLAGHSSDGDYNDIDVASLSNGYNFDTDQLGVIDNAYKVYVPEVDRSVLIMEPLIPADTAIDLSLAALETSALYTDHIFPRKNDPRPFDSIAFN